MPYQPRERESAAQEPTREQLTADLPPAEPPFAPGVQRFFDKVRFGRLHPVDPDLEFDPEDIRMAQQLESGITAASPLTFDTGAPPWQCIAGGTFTAALVSPPGVIPGHLGARVENPGTRAIVTAYRLASLTGEMYTVTLDSPLIPGPYELVWRTDDAEPPAFEQFIPLIAISVGAAASDSSSWPPIDPVAVAPTVDDIAAMEGTRARNQDTGDFVDTFDDSTYPTGRQVQALISDAVNDVLAAIPDTIDPAYWPRVTTAAKYLTAVLIEQSYFRNAQGGPSSGVVLTYQARLQAVLAALSQTNTATAQRLV